MNAGQIQQVQSGDTLVTGSAALALNGIISPTSLGSDQNDYNPSGLSGATAIRLTASTTVNVTGLQGGSDGRILVLHNVGSTTITLKTASTSSSAANRFDLTADVALAASMAVLLQYDNTSQRWRLVGGTGGGNASALVAYTGDATITHTNNGQISTVTGSVSTTLDSAMNGLALPQASITVGSTSGFAASGTVYITSSNGIQAVAYTSKDATHFLGCTGGTGTLATGGSVGVQITLTLSGLSLADELRFSVTTNATLKIVAPASMTISLGDKKTSAVAGFVRANTIGSQLRLVVVSSTQIAASVDGTWYADS